MREYFDPLSSFYEGYTYRVRHRLSEIMKLVEENGSITRSEIVRKLGITENLARDSLKILGNEKGLITYDVSKKRWFLTRSTQ